MANVTAAYQVSLWVGGRQTQTFLPCTLKVCIFQMSFVKYKILLKIPGTALL